MSEYVKFRKVENVEITYNGPTYLSMRTGDTMSTGHADFRDGMLGLINVSCKITKLDGTIVNVVNENGFDFNIDYGDVIRYKDSEGNIKSFNGSDKLTEIRLDGNYLEITPVFVCEVNDFGQERVKMILNESGVPKYYTEQPIEIKQHHINQDIIYGGDEIEFDLGYFPDADGYTLTDPHYFLYWTTYKWEQLWLVKTTDLGNDLGLAIMEYPLLEGDYWDDNYNGDFDYNGKLYHLDAREGVSGLGLTLSFQEQSFLSLNNITIRVDGIDRVDITTTHGVSNPKIIGQSFTHNDIKVKVIYTDGKDKELNYSLGEYTFENESGFIINNEWLNSIGLKSVKIKLGAYYHDDNETFIERTKLKLIAVRNNEITSIKLYSNKTTFIYGERFSQVYIRVMGRYQITASIYYEQQLNSNEYTLNIANGTQIFTETELVATYQKVVGRETDSITLYVEIDTRQELLVYDKLTNAEKNFGGIDISSGFNIAYNLDGTLDSATIQVFNGEDYALETNTLCMLTFNRSWWVVKSDKKEYVNSETSNKWKHTIELLDPRHLLKSRSLVSCGFNKDRYTYQTFFDRLIALSNYENATVSLGSVFNPNNKVKVIKSFDNYTLGKALDEFANSENAIHKVDYIDSGNPYIYFLSKSGNNNTIIDLDTDTKHKVASYVNEEMGNKDFASKVISNIENAISSVPQRYPLTGGKFLDSDAFELTKDNAYFKMPSKAFKVNKLIIMPSVVICKYKSVGGSETDKKATRSFYAHSTQQILDILKADMPELTSVNEYSLEEFSQAVFDVLRTELPIDKQEKLLTNRDGSTNPMFISENMSAKHDKQDWYFKFKEGDNKITNFKCLDYTSGSMTNGTKIKEKKNAVFNFNASGGFGERSCVAKRRIAVDIENQTYTYIGVYASLLSPLDTKFAVEYIPQSDMVMSYENGTKTKDITLFNQTGNFIDNFAVSKLVKSYATDISGNTHNYYTYYDKFFDILEVGRKVNKIINGKQELMVISNVSIDVINGDKYAVMYTLSKYSAVKSLMISADSQIRDYDTPQRNNVKRKQNYKDYIELSFSQYVGTPDTTYTHLSNLPNLLTLESKRKGSQVDYVAFIGIDNWHIDSETINPNARYFQIPTYAIYYDSSVSVVVDFNDNNIIGYDKSNQGTIMEWDISKWNTFFGTTKRYNIPINYTASSGDFGELTQIEIKLADKSVIDSTFEYFRTFVVGLDNQDYSDYNITEIAPLSQKIFHEIMGDHQVYLLEEHYNKDGLEVPFFQYTFQVGNTKDIKVGSRILVNPKSSVDKIFLYQFHIRNDAMIDDSNFNELEIESINGNEITIENACVIYYHENVRYMKIHFYSIATFNIQTGAISNTTNYTSQIENKNVEIVCASYENGVKSDSELIFAMNNCGKELTSESILEINVSNYKR